MPSDPPRAPFRAAASAWPTGLGGRLEALGLRRTQATLQVLGLFLAQPEAAHTHAQLQEALVAQGSTVNRVTLYRLLDRLVAAGVLERQADDAARTWWFRLADLSEGVNAVGGAPRTRLDFECEACHQHFRLPQAGPSTQAVAQDLMRTLDRLGHRAERVALQVRGTCAGCAQDGPQPDGAAGVRA